MQSPIAWRKDDLNGAHKALFACANLRSKIERQTDGEPV